jgi:hypothetical protein
MVNNTIRLKNYLCVSLLGSFAAPGGNYVMLFWVVIAQFVAQALQNIRRFCAGLTEIFPTLIDRWHNPSADLLPNVINEMSIDETTKLFALFAGVERRLFAKPGTVKIMVQEPRGRNLGKCIAHWQWQTRCHDLR